MLAPQLDMPLMAVPDFVAGFVYGMTGDNNLTEIEACFQGGELMAGEIETGVQDIKAGGWNNDVQAALNFALVALQVPQSLSTCESMGDDISAIEEWASVFKNPAALAKKAAKHYAFHKAEVKADIAALEADWSNAGYFKAGADLADLLTLVVGPIETFAVGGKNNFPKDSSFHAGCHVTATFEGTSCDSLYALVDNEIRTWDADLSPAGGDYQLKEEAQDDYIWSTRLTLNKKYTDDQLFEFQSSTTGCNVVSKSRSQSVSYLDNDVNFCNLWNVFNGTGAAFTYSVSHCSGEAKDPVTTCARY